MSTGVFIGFVAVALVLRFGIVMAKRHYEKRDRDAQG
jgi:hypothetical protein